MAGFIFLLSYKRSHGQIGWTAREYRCKNSATTTASIRRQIISQEESYRSWRSQSPARLVDVQNALVENFPTDNNPGPYIIGVGDVITLNEINTNSQGTRHSIFGSVVDEKGFIHVFGLGQLKASG